MDPPMGYGFPQTPVLGTFLWRLVLHLGSQPVAHPPPPVESPGLGVAASVTKKTGTDRGDLGKLGSRKKNLSLEKSSELNSSRGDVCLPEKDLIEIMERRVRFGATAWMMGEGYMVT